MNVGEIRKIKQLLEMYGARPNKDLGQHFLIEEKYLDQIMDAAAPLEGKTALEIGPGLGVLTKKLSKEASQVVAIEVDGRMVSILKTVCLNCTNLTVKEMDVRHYDPAQLGEYKIVANLPYYLTSHIIRKFLEEKNKPEEMVILVQKEVADRICAKPNRMSTLSVSVQFYGAPEMIGVVPREAFYPTPQVSSAIVKIKTYKTPLFSDVNTEKFFRLVKAGFGEKRKQLVNSLATLGYDKEELRLFLKKVNINPERRAETLTLAEWRNIYKIFYPKS
jgi:16S rRNA (adenine1518-N6/adenine1519-N6)-dimethyltransferase